jgi:hypothetical protein
MTSEIDGLALRPLTPDPPSTDRWWHRLGRLRNGHLVDDEIPAEITDDVTQRRQSPRAFLRRRADVGVEDDLPFVS